jgi:hypothetical protein
LMGNILIYGKYRKGLLQQTFGSLYRMQSRCLPSASIL